MEKEKKFSITLTLKLSLKFPRVHWKITKYLLFHLIKKRDMLEIIRFVCHAIVLYGKICQIRRDKSYAYVKFVQVNHYECILQIAWFIEISWRFVNSIVGCTVLPTETFLKYSSKIFTTLKENHVLLHSDILH